MDVWRLNHRPKIAFLEWICILECNTGRLVHRSQSESGAAVALVPGTVFAKHSDPKAALLLAQELVEKCKQADKCTPPHIADVLARFAAETTKRVMPWWK